MKSFSLKQFLLGVFFFSIFTIGCRVDKIDDLDPFQNTAAEEVCLLQISGKVLNTKTFEPLPNVQIQSTHFIVDTDQNGEFTVELNQLAINDLDQIQLSKEGYLMNKFFADYNAVINASSCAKVTSFNWELSLSPKQIPQWIGVEGTPEFHIMDTISFAQPLATGEVEILQDTRDYTIKIGKNDLEKWANLSISPNNGTAYGTGIVLSEDLFSLARLVVTEEGGISPDGLVTTYTNDDVNFQQPIEIAFANPKQLYEKNNLTSLDMVNLTINELGNAALANNQIKINLFSTGNLYIGFNDEVTDLMINVLEAIEKGYETDEAIDALFNNSTATARNNNVSISSSISCDGAIVDQQILDNCDCSEAKTERYRARTRNFANINIQFPNGTSNGVRRRAFNMVRSFLGSGTGQVSVNLVIALPKCTRKRITSTESILKVEGTVLGFPFTYEGLSHLNTTEELLDCPTTSACHQGCPN